MSLFTKIFGDENTKALKAYQPLVEQVNALEEKMKALSDADLKTKTGEFKKRLEEGATLDDLLPEAFATVREASKRTLGQRHFDVQLLGGIAIHKGNIAEMRTGEGKTLVATLPAYLNALTGKGVHIVTVNDYLARRDATWMGQIYDFLGLTVGVINSNNEAYVYDSLHVSKEKEEAAEKEQDEDGYFKVVYEFLRPASRKEVYDADITYGTNSEFGFDYLRDNLVYEEEGLRQKDFNYAIIDEIDSVLIDEARTPLIISAPSIESENLYKTFAEIARGLAKDEDYTVDEKRNAIQLTDSGIEKAEKALGIENIYTDKGIKHVHHLENAVRAKALYHKDKEYVVRDGNIVIVDSFTGRLMPSRRWSGGLHQAIEAKEGLEVQRESQTFASITYQNYFRMYKKLSGMTGTAKTSEEEFRKVYGLDVIVIPTNKPVARIDHDDLIFQTEKGKFKAIARKVKEVNEKGQPVLIGTVSIERNEMLSKFLTEMGVKHEILNAKNHEKEALIIADAGRKGAVTIATNMAGRGVDIKLGGEDATEEQKEEIRSLGGLFVLGTERHEARRIDNQLRGRSGRQGDPGTTQFFVSLEDDLMRVFASDSIKRMMGTLGIAEDEPIQNKLITRSLESAQEKIEGFHFDARKNVLAYDDVLNHQRKTIYERRRRILLGSEAEILGELERLVLGDEGVSKVFEGRRNALGDEQFIEVVRRINLQSIDVAWVEHLEAMEYLRSSVSLRAYGQHDPLIEYKKEGLLMFRDLEARVDQTIIRLISNIGQGAFDAEEKKLKAVEDRAENIAGGDDNKPAISDKPKTEDGDKIGRNDFVTISKDGQTQTIKYKKAKDLIEGEGWTIVEFRK